MPGILVKVDEDYLRHLDRKIRDYFEKKQRERVADGKIHISDLTYCMRKAIISRKWPEKVKLNILDYTTFMDGLGSEKMLVEVLTDGLDAVAAQKTSYQEDIAFDDFSAHPDFIDEERIVFEFKTSGTIQHLVLSNDSLKSYVRQTVYYMILLGIKKGRVLVRYKRNDFPEYVCRDDLTCLEIADDKHKFKGDNQPLYKLRFHKDTGQFPFFSAAVELELDDPVRKKVTDSLIKIIKPIYKANDVEQIPRLENYPMNWKCNYCNVKEVCAEIPDSQKDYYKRNILLNKHIDNVVTNEYHRHKVGRI